MSLFTLGTMRALESQVQMLSVLRSARLAGINHVETAPAYGPAETFLGQALRQLDQEDSTPAEGNWIITSKLLPGQPLDQARRALEASLKRLSRPSLDNLAIHGINREEHLHWALSGDGAALIDWALASGKVGQVGFTSHGSSALIQRAIHSNRFRFCGLHLHLLDPQHLPLMMEALDRQMGVLAISPADKGGRLQAPSDQLINDCAPFTPLALAYRFLLAAGVSTLTVGAEKPTDLNLANALANQDGPLEEPEAKVLDRLEALRHERLGLEFCGQCRACLPCPQAVPIPELLRLRNLTLGHDLREFAEERYNLIGRAGHWWETVKADACAQCGDCLPRCPYHLPIPSLLKDTHHRLAAAPRRRLWG